MNPEILLNDAISKVDEALERIRQEQRALVDAFINETVLNVFVGADVDYYTFVMYTPGFNDGDPCVNDVATPDVWEHDGKVVLDSDLAVNGLSDEDVERILRTCTNLHERGLLQKMNSLFGKMENMFLASYGTNVRITLSLHENDLGHFIAVDVEEGFDCGW